MSEKTDRTDDGAAKSDFPIVAIGASAGGIEALRQLFSRLPADTGMAFVVIQHLDPGRPSMLSSVLAADVQMPVVEVAAGMRAEPNRVCVIPPDADLSIHQGLLELVPRQQARKLHLPIDSFFRALALDSSDQAIGVVLSGSASDGTEGLRAIKAAGGITFAQEPESAQFRSMPESAIAAGVVDFRLTPEEIASELARLSRHSYLAPSSALEASAEQRPLDDEGSIPIFRPAERHHPARDAQRQADHVLLTRYAPPGVVVNDRLEVIQFRGRTGDFLEAPPGQPQTNILKLAREGLVGHLREALETAKAQSVTVRKQSVRITEDAQARSIDLEVVPLLAGVASTAEHYFLVVFEERAARESAEGPLPAAQAGSQRAAQREPDEEVARLRTELAATRDYLRAVTGEHLDTTEELGAANEELSAANEELQSTNEELQSAKEELQSTNEELTTLNEELNNRNQQLDLVANDLANVLESVQIPVIIVDQALRIRRFTPAVREISSLLHGDVGRSIDDVKLKVRIYDLVEKIRETIESVTPKEYEVQGLDGRWFTLHIRPYRTTDSRLDGAVLSFVDVVSTQNTTGSDVKGSRPGRPPFSSLTATPGASRRSR